MIYYVRCPECGENMDWTVTVDRDTVVAGYRCTCQDDDPEVLIDAGPLPRMPKSSRIVKAKIRQGKARFL